ncbi:hypothetical protein BLOT_005536 [Blomia tropicalis]|nr:hypothetical protein BLOT_005536 [Blomia tropicalis]
MGFLLRVQIEQKRLKGYAPFNTTNVKTLDGVERLVKVSLCSSSSSSSSSSIMMIKHYLKVKIDSYRC